MGFLSKAWKGVKKGFKSIGKGIKSAFKKFGKFMGKIGVFGQIAMMFILPGIGGALMKGLGGAFSSVVGQTAAQAAATAAGTAASAAATTAGATAVTAAAQGATAAAATASTIAAGTAAGASAAAVAAGTTALGTATASGLMSMGAIGQGVGTVLQAASNFVSVGANAFSTVTEGVSSFIGEFGKTALNKIPGINIEGAASNFFTPASTGSSTAWGNVQANVMGNATKTLASFNKAIGYTPPVPAPVVSSTPTMGTSGTPTATDSFGPMKEGFAMPETPPLAGVDTPYVDIPNAQNSLMANPTATGPLATDPIFSVDPVNPVSRTEQFAPNFGPKEGQRGFFENATNKISETYRDFVDDPVSALVGEDPVGKAADQFTGQIINTGAQRLVMGKPEAGRAYSFNMTAPAATAEIGQYLSPEINARAYEMATNPIDFAANNLFGNPAGLVQQAYMRSMAKSGFGG